ncbi:Respiratory supercomplex factor 1, mitochondrial [Malassezia yamatoensis]|uniref:Respiratory supercomplex factor 1, mitochondrial n=1 Tax=Malassezia yamatoensis TaxID=253288 RepID=A0AAJ5YRI5_9BASI|nr:Respiratory supercomplex factor 1, mitochondrial [Malassezia yamatoensis]
MSTDNGDHDPFIPTSVDDEETNSQRILRKMKEDPLVPIGCVLTTVALTYASYALRKGNRETFQRALRYRVLFQTVTVVAAAASLFFIKAPPTSTPAPKEDGSPGEMPKWNQDRLEQREKENKVDWANRFREAHARDQRENAAIKRMVEEELRSREQEASSTPAPPATEDSTPPVSEAAGTQARREPPKIGQDKRRFTFRT